VAPLEVIVIDDGSTDSSREIVQQFGNAVTLIAKKNEGPAIARIIGASRARAEWLAFCDSDDLWMPEKLEKQLRLAGEAPEVHLVITDYTDMTDGVLSERSHFSYAPEEFWKLESVPSGFVVRESITQKLTTYQPSIVGPPIVRREFCQRVGTFDEKAIWAEDTCFHFRCLSTVPFGVVPEVLVYYRRHPHSLSADPTFQLRNTVKVWEYIIAEYPEAQPHREQLELGLLAMRQEVKVTERYLRRQKLKRMLGFK
jgi:glycosyltransferase involved in cell wall biosynthesis